MIEYPLGSVSVVTEFQAKTSAVTRKTLVKTLGGITEMYYAVEYL